MQRKNLLITFLIIGIIVLVIGIFIVETLGTLQQPSQPPVIMPSPTVVPTLILGRTVNLMAVEPPPDPQGTRRYSPVQSFLFRFDKEMDPDKIQIEVLPQVELRGLFGRSPKELFISPAGPDYWKPDTLYTLTIKKGSRAIDGSQLPQDIVFRFMAKLQGGD